MLTSYFLKGPAGFSCQHVFVNGTRPAASHHRDSLTAGREVERVHSYGLL